MSKSLIPTLLLLTACATTGSAADAPTTAPSQEPETSSAGANASDEGPVVTLDDSAPMKLEDWRKVKKAGEAAARTPELTARIEQCKQFIADNEGHHVSGDVLEALTDAMVEKGDYDPAELARFVEMRCQTDEDATRLPVELVREYHLEHGLPLTSALRMLEEARDRLDRDWARDVEAEADPAQRRRAAMWIDHQRVQTHVLEGRIQLESEAPEVALAALDRAEETARNVPSGIVLRSEKPRTLPTGRQDELHVLRAAALKRLGRDAEAQAAFAETVGFVSDVALRELYDETKVALGVQSEGERMITAQAQLAEDFALQDLSGKKVELSDYHGKVVLLTFWATWCGPCKKELPVLQKFLAANRSKGVEVLAINTEGFNSRSKIPPFLEKEGLGQLKVLFKDDEQLSSYNYGAIPALYVIDREGRIAHARTGYDSDLQNKLDNEIAELVSAEGKDAQRDLFSVELAPEGFDVQWKRTVSGNTRAVAIARGAEGKPGELAIVGREGLMRWNASGDAQGSTPLSGFTMGAHAADLDGDGRTEWVLAGWQSLKVVDAQGDIYWDYEMNRMADVRGIADLDGDGFSEIVVKDEDAVLAMKAVPEPRWKTDAIEGLEAVGVAGSDVLVQVDGQIRRYDAAGNTKGKPLAAPEGMQTAGTATIDGKSVPVFHGRWDDAPITDADIDGDGKDDIVVISRSGVVAYDHRGTPILKIRGEGAGLSAAVGDLDGNPGAELAIFVEHYGLVVLGAKN